MWVWHVPALYDAALRHPFVHVLEHTFFMTAGLLYWWHLLSPIRTRLRLSGMGPVVYMLSTKLLVGLLGIGLTFAPDALYAFYKDQPRDLGPQRRATTRRSPARSWRSSSRSSWASRSPGCSSARWRRAESDEQRAERYA